MSNWEYQITRHRLENLTIGEVGGQGKSFHCDQKGECFLHDTSDQAAEMIRQAFDEEGRSGWELVQFGYHLGELLCVWKRRVD
jgi:hypothetical protein